MNKLVFYHNPRCSKSREVATMLEASGKSFEIREYLKKPLSQDELENLYSLLSVEDKELFVRIKEAEFKEAPFDIKDAQVVLKKLIEIPKLMERPIVMSEKRAIIGRPISKIQELIS